MKEWLFSRFQAKAHETVKWDMVTYEQDIMGDISSGFQQGGILHVTAKRMRQRAQRLRFFINKILEVFQYE